MWLPAVVLPVLFLSDVRGSAAGRVPAPAYDLLYARYR